MANGTTFHFVEGEPHEALAQAAEAADGRDVVLGGGTSTIRRFLAAGLVDEMHLVIALVILSSGERLFDQPQPILSGYSCTPLSCDGSVAHADLTRTELSENLEERELAGDEPTWDAGCTSHIKGQSAGRIAE